MLKARDKEDGMNDILTDLGQSLLDLIEQSNKEREKLLDPIEKQRKQLWDRIKGNPNDGRQRT
jgi:hypothetical protein